MSAEILREAAAEIRGLAEGAAPGPWRFKPEGDSECGEPGCCWDYWENGVVDQDGDRVMESHVLTEASGRHIAGADPGVMLSVADWLDFVANWCPVEDEAAWEQADTHHFHALQLALTYLGRAEAAT